MTPLFQFGRKRFCHILALSLVLVVGAFALLQAVHMHPGAQLDSLHCSICLAAHHSTAIVSVPLALPELALTEAALLLPVSDSAHAALLGSLYSRPPPNL